MYVDGKYKGKFDSASKKITLPRNGWHTIRVVEDVWSTSSRAGKTGYVQTNNPSYYWDCTSWKDIKSW